MVEEKKKRRREEEEGGKANDELKFKINPNKFFKLILPHILEQNSRLRIPETFAKKFTPQIRTYATLTTRTISKIVVERIENGLYFTEGWAKFMEDNHIKYGYFLEFEYEGNNHFKVYIFDLSCTEIEYPVVEYDQHANQNVLRNRIRDGKSKENQEAVGEDEDEAEKDKHKDGVVLESNRHSSNPSFSIVVRNCSLLRVGGAYLHIPRNFTKEHMEGGHTGHLFKYVTLEGEEGRDWCIDCYFCDGVGLRLNGPRWRKFVLHYDWEVGDTYTFVLVDKKQHYATFKVIKM